MKFAALPRSRGALLTAFLCAACAPKPAPIAVRTGPPLLAAAARTRPAAVVASGYDKPPAALAEILHAPSPPAPYVSPTGERILLISYVDYPPMARVAEPFLRLAGVRVEPRTRNKRDTSGGYGLRPCIRELSVVTVAGGAEKKIALPPGACPMTPVWAPDSSRFVFVNIADSAVELWLADAASGEARVVPGARLNPMLGSTVQWLAGSRSLLVKLVPDDLGPPPPAPPVPVAPSIQETNGEEGESSTYETRDTLKNGHDEDLFDYYATTQLAIVDPASLAVSKVGKPDLYSEIDAAPDGRHVLVTTVHKPYSYINTYERFAHDVAVLDLTSGDVRTMASLPLADRVPVQGEPTGPRDFAWRQNEPATLFWVEALDNGDWNVSVPARDKVFMQRAPFTAAPVEILRLEQRFGGFEWSSDARLAFLFEYDENKHWKRVFTVDVDDRKSKPRLLFSLSTDERYQNPGGFVLRQLPGGEVVVRQDGNDVYLAGAGGSPTGDRPFLDRLDLGTRKTVRLFRSERTAYESFLAFASAAPRENRILTWHQTPTDPPNAFIRTLGRSLREVPAGEPALASTSTAITHLADPTPAVRGIKKRLVTYKRADGTDLSFTLLTPPDYKEGTRLPAILYAYPLDYTDPRTAGQVSGSEQTFTMLRDYRLLLLAGYAIIDKAAFPIVGDPRKAYDTYLDQLVADAKAAVDKAVELGVVDPERVAVTGHSHGALMTANLLAHSDLFRAGAATSGAYNKTLTPFGFQSERRSVWEAQHVYLEASPFFFADKLKAPILIIHGEDDANPGTTPLQATKFYEAVRGNGGTARLVMLPHEPHWYTAMESNEQEVAEMLRWFDRYVKNAPPRGSTASPGRTGELAPAQRTLR